jgi:chemotaxis protein methyltransferase CheR
VVDRFFDSLVGGGWLVVGHSEPSVDIYRRFRARNYPDTVLYQRMSDTATLRALGSRRVLASPMPIPMPPAATPIATPVNAFLPEKQDGGAWNVIPAIPEPAREVNPLDHARELLEYGHSEEARSLLLTLTKKSPASAAVSALLGQANANLGNWAEAEAWCLKAIDQNRLILDAYYTLSLVMQHQGKIEQAIASMKRVVYIDNANVLGHYGLATLYYESNRLPLAQKSLENALRLLQDKADDGVIPGSQGITIGRLRAAITSQQQAWSL